MNWRGKPLTTYRIIVELIAATTTQTGLRVQADLEPGYYPTGPKSPTNNSPPSPSPATTGTPTGTTTSPPNPHAANELQPSTPTRQPEHGVRTLWVVVAGSSFRGSRGRSLAHYLRTGSQHALVSRRKRQDGGSYRRAAFAARHCDGSAAVAASYRRRFNKESWKQPLASLEWRLSVRRHPFVGHNGLSGPAGWRRSSSNLFYSFFLGAVYDPSTRDSSR